MSPIEKSSRALPQPYVPDLQAQAQPILDRENDAVASVRALGLKDRDIKKLASKASDLLLGPDKPDGTTARDKLVKQLEKKIDAPRGAGGD